MVTWGIVAAAFMFVQGPTSFYVLRFLLGVMEAGFFPGVILFLTYWVPARHLSRARGYFLYGHRAGGHFRYPLSGGLLELNGISGLKGIQWMFLVEGLLAVAVGIWSYFYLTDRPREATWMPADEQQALSETIEAEDTAKDDGARTEEGLAALGNWRVWYFALIYFCIQIAVYGVTFFLPTQVTAITGQKLGFQASLVTAIPWVFGLACGRVLPRSCGPHPQAPADRLVAPPGHRLRHRHLWCAQRYSRARDRRPFPGGDGFCLDAADLLDPADRVHDRLRRGCGHRLDQLPGQPWRLPGAILRDYFKAPLGGNAGLYSFSVGRVPGAILFALTAFFKKANEIEAGHLDEIDAQIIVSSRTG